MTHLGVIWYWMLADGVLLLLLFLRLL